MGFLIGSAIFRGLRIKSGPYNPKSGLDATNMDLETDSNKCPLARRRVMSSLKSHNSSIDSVSPEAGLADTHLSTLKFWAKRFKESSLLSLTGTGDSQRDSRESIRVNHSQLKPVFFIARQADSHESLEFPIRANHATKFHSVACRSQQSRRK